MRTAIPMYTDLYGIMEESLFTPKEFWDKFPNGVSKKQIQTTFRKWENEYLKNNDNVDFVFFEWDYEDEDDDLCI